MRKILTKFLFYGEEEKWLILWFVRSKNWLTRYFHLNQQFSIQGDIAHPHSTGV
jgi:hypothetical protein